MSENTETFDVKFRTQEPVEFTECSDKLQRGFIGLQGLLAGICSVSGYDASVYRDPGAAADFIRKNAQRIIRDCFDAWDQAEPLFLGNSGPRIARYFDERLSEAGITASTRIAAFVLTPDSERILKRNLEEGGDPSLGADSMYIVNGPDVFHTSSGPVPVVPQPGTMPSPAVIRNGKDDRYCRLCGEKRRDGARFCAGCGAGFGGDGK